MVDTDKVSEVIEVIRPAIQADAGDIFLRGVDAETGVVSVELVECLRVVRRRRPSRSRPASSASSDRVPGVTEVVDVGAPTERRQPLTRTAVAFPGCLALPSPI